MGLRSRGAIPNAWLKRAPTTEHTLDWFLAKSVEEHLFDGVGGFSLLCGTLKRSTRSHQGIEPLAIISNRTLDPTAITWALNSPDEVLGLSNSAFDDPWPKVQSGTNLLRKAIEDSVAVKESEDELLDRLFEVLTIDSLPARKEDEPFESYVQQLRHSIFIPALRADATPSSSVINPPSLGVGDPPARSGISNLIPPNETSSLYGTQKQTIILVNHRGQVTLVERSLFDNQSKPVPIEERDRKFSFDLPSWNVYDGSPNS